MVIPIMAVMIKRPGRQTVGMQLMLKMAFHGAGMFGHRKKRRKKGKKEIGQG